MQIITIVSNNATNITITEKCYRKNTTKSTSKITT